MSRRFKQLLNLYLDNVIDQMGLIELKHLLANNVENQKGVPKTMQAAAGDEAGTAYMGTTLKLRLNERRSGVKHGV